MRFFAGRRSFGATRARRRRLSGDRRARTLRRCARAVCFARADGAACGLLAFDPNGDLGQMCVAARTPRPRRFQGRPMGECAVICDGRDVRGRRGLLYLRVGRDGQIPKGPGFCSRFLLTPHRANDRRLGTTLSVPGRPLRRASTTATKVLSPLISARALSHSWI